MRNLAATGHRFLKAMRTETGSHFRGTLIPVLDREGAAIDYSSHRVALRTLEECLVKPADVIITPSGDRYMVAEGFSAEANWTTWRLYKCERQVRWQRPGTTTDALTGLSKASGPPLEKGLIWVNTEIERRMFSDPGLNLPVERFSYITPSPVVEGDILDGKKVVRSNHELGVYLVEVR